MEMQEHLIAKEIALQVDAAERSIENWEKKSEVSALGFLLFCFAWCSILVRIKPWILEPSLPEAKPASPTRQLGGRSKPASSSVKQGWKGAPTSLGCYVASVTLTAQSEARSHRLMAESSHFRH